MWCAVTDDLNSYNRCRHIVKNAFYSKRSEMLGFWAQVSLVIVKKNFHNKDLRKEE